MDINTASMFILILMTTLGGNAKNLRPRGTDLVILGYPAELGQIPHHIGVLLDPFHEATFDSPLCGGALIHPSFVITAAHCCFYMGDPLWPEHYEIYAGGLTINGSKSDGIFRNVSNVTPHPDFTLDGLSNDICLLELEQPMPLIEGRIGVAQLPQLHENPAYEDYATISGWGYSVHWQFPSTLQYAELKLQYPEFCIKRFQDANMSFDPDRDFCAGMGDHQSPGGCFGDSGGPLTYHGEVIGVVSRGDAEEESPDELCIGTPVIFTMVSSYVDWIEAIIKEAMP